MDGTVPMHGVQSVVGDEESEIYVEKIIGSWHSMSFRRLISGWHMERSNVRREA
jgi:hypothetical protein